VTHERASLRSREWFHLLRERFLAPPSPASSISDRERCACWSSGLSAGLRAGVWALQNAGQTSPLQRFERHAFWIESDRYDASRAIAIFAEVQVHFQGIIVVGVIEALAVEHHDTVRILFDGSRFTDVGKLRNRGIPLLALV